MSKGYCSWGSDISPDETPREAGLNFAVDFNKPFLGRDSLVSKRKAPATKRRAILVLEDPRPVLWGGEPIWQSSRKVGYTTSGAYGHSLGSAITMGYVPFSADKSKEAPLNSHFEIEINGQRHAAKAFTRPPYDSTGLHIRSQVIAEVGFRTYYPEVCNGLRSYLNSLRAILAQVSHPGTYLQRLPTRARYSTSAEKVRSALVHSPAWRTLFAVGLTRLR